MKYINGFICNSCYSSLKGEISINIPSIKKDDIIYPDGSYICAKFHCKHCGRITDHFNVDYGIAKLISLLNKNGFQTNYSCQGHLRKEKAFIPEYVMSLNTNDYIEYLLSLVSIQDAYIMFTTENTIFGYKGKDIFTRKFPRKAFDIILKSDFKDIDFSYYIDPEEKYSDTERVYIRNSDKLSKKEKDDLYKKYINNRLSSGFRIGLSVQKATNVLVDIIDKYKYTRTEDSVKSIIKEYEEYSQSCIDRLYADLSVYFKYWDDKSDIKYFNYEEYLKGKYSEESKETS